MFPAAPPSCLDLSINDLVAAFANGGLTPLDVLDTTLAHHAAVNPVINALPYLDEAGARESAERATARWAASRPLSRLDGVPVSVKDSVNAIGLPWRHGSRPNDAIPVSKVDAPPSARLRESGAVIVGKTSMPDFGMLASGVSSLYGVVRNPWDIATTPGGSSSGAGASLAAALTWGAIGTDIAGSVRLPAAHCGIVALKPTQGRVPHLAPSTVRSAGPMARSVADVIDVYRIVSRFDERDTLALAPEDDGPVVPLTDDDVAQLRVGVMEVVGCGFTADEPTLRTLRSAASVFAEAGARITELPAPLSADAFEALDTLYLVRALTEYETHSVQGQTQVLPQLVRWIRRGVNLTASDYERALLRVSVDQQSFASAHREYDIVLSPVLPTATFPAEEVGLNVDRPLEHCSFTAWYNQTGQPAIALPYGEDDGHPVAVQIAAPRLRDRALLSVAAWLEAKRGTTPDWPVNPRPVPGPVWRQP